MKKRTRRKTTKQTGEQKRKQEEIFLKQYNIELAVTARRVLMLEAHNWEDCLNLVYHPTQRLLEQLAKQNPKFLLCFSGEPYTYQKPDFPGDKSGLSADLYLITPDKKVLYLGTVLDRKEAHSLYEWFLESFPGQKEILKKRGPMTIVRQRIRCRIPVEADTLNRKAMEQGLRKYMKTFVPALSCVPIRWLSKNKQAILEAYICEQANLQAKPQTKEEKTRIFRSDAT